MIKAILYDFDGVIVQSLVSCYQAYVQSLSQFGKKATKQQVVDTCFMNPIEVTAKSWGISDVDRFDKLYWEYLQEGYTTVDLYPDTRQVLEQLRNNGVELALGTLNMQYLLEPILHRLDLMEFFKVRVTHDTANNKLMTFSQAIDMLGLSPDQVMVIGDSKHDIIAANKLGCKSVLFFPDSNKEYYDFDELNSSGPDHVIKSHNEILDIIHS